MAKSVTRIPSTVAKITGASIVSLSTGKSSFSDVLFDINR